MNYSRLMFGLLLYIAALQGVFRPDAVAEAQAPSGLALFRARVAKNPNDYLSAGILAQLLNSTARTTANFELYLEAEKVARRGLAAKEDHRPLQLELGVSVLAQHECGEAQTIAKKLLTEIPGVDAQSLAFDGAFECGDFATAEQILTQLKSAAPTEPAILHRAAKLLEMQGKFQEAISSLQNAVGESAALQDPSELQAWYLLQLSERLLRYRQLAQCEKEVARAAEFTPDSAFVLEHQGELAAVKGNLDQAERYFARALEKARTPQILQALGDLATIRRDTAKAAKQYADLQGFLESSLPSGKRYYFHHLAFLYSDLLPEPEKAVYYASKDLEGRKTPFTYEALAWSLFRAGEFDEARLMANKALETGILDPHILYHASLIFGAVGEEGLAKEKLERAKSINPYVNVFHVHR